MAKVFILKQLKYMLTFINLNRHPIETTNFWERNLPGERKSSSIGTLRLEAAREGHDVRTRVPGRQE